MIIWVSTDFRWSNVIRGPGSGLHRANKEEQSRGKGVVASLPVKEDVVIAPTSTGRTKRLHHFIVKPLMWLNY